jgi:hypothetical protein
MEHPQSEPTADSTHVIVVVVRTGGIAGLRKQWRAEPPPPEAPRWIALIDECPWDDEPAESRGADRYVWHIQALRDDAPPREAQLPDSRLNGPWRVLVDHVRESAPPAAPRPGRSVREE